MQIARILLILGLWVAILPYLGFPIFIKNILFVLTGFSFIYLSLVVYKEKRVIKKKASQVFENFSENNSFEDIKVD